MNNFTKIKKLYKKDAKFIILYINKYIIFSPVPLAEFGRNDVVSAVTGFPFHTPVTDRLRVYRFLFKLQSF